MIKLHPKITDVDVVLKLKTYLQEYPINSYHSKKGLILMYNLFSWIYLDKDILTAFEKNNIELYNFFKKYDLKRFKGDSLEYSAVLFYKKLSKSICMRGFDEGKIIEIENFYQNKKLEEKDFINTELYNIYKNSKEEIPENLLLLNSVFIDNYSKELENISSVSDVLKTTSKSDLVRADFKYKLITKKLLINNYKNNVLEDSKKELIILQDCTNSMEKYSLKLLSVKSYILNIAFKNNYVVQWYFASNEVKKHVIYSNESIKEKDVDLIFSGTNVDFSKLLSSDKFINKKVIIITDGTDSFNFKFKPKTRDINVLSFKNNKEIKNKLITYGKFFKI